MKLVYSVPLHLFVSWVTVKLARLLWAAPFSHRLYINTKASLISIFFKPNTSGWSNQPNAPQTKWDKWPNAWHPRRTTLFLWGCRPPWRCYRTDWWSEYRGSIVFQSWCRKQSWWSWTLNDSCRYSKSLHRPQMHFPLSSYLLQNNIKWKLGVRQKKRICHLWYKTSFN